MELYQPQVEEIVDPDIRERYENSSRNCYTQHFVARDEGREVGFLSLDLGPLDEPFVIYELFVPRHLRRNGFGTKLLAIAEQKASSLGYEWTLIIPRTMDDVFSQADLESWYTRRRYEKWEEHAFGGIRKRVTPDSESQRASCRAETTNRLAAVK